MRITLAAILPRTRRPNPDHPEALFADYTQRIARYIPVETQSFLTEAAMFTWLDQPTGRAAHHLTLLDSRGKQLSSEAFATHLGRLRDSGAQNLIFAIGPADGWSETARTRANLLLSLSSMTLPHQLARVLLAEQVYRAFTILAGHPYHSGH
jgi:23S rRNA (pseudouridine1915-N3)-methyltransferase